MKKNIRYWLNSIWEIYWVSSLFVFMLTIVNVYPEYLHYSLFFFIASLVCPLSITIIFVILSLVNILSKEILKSKLFIIITNVLYIYSLNLFDFIDTFLYQTVLAHISTFVVIIIIDKFSIPNKFKDIQKNVKMYLYKVIIKCLNNSGMTAHLDIEKILDFFFKHKFLSLLKIILIILLLLVILWWKGSHCNLILYDIETSNLIINNNESIKYLNIKIYKSPLKDGPCIGIFNVELNNDDNILSLKYILEKYYIRKNVLEKEDSGIKKYVLYDCQYIIKCMTIRNTCSDSIILYSDFYGNIYEVK